MEQKDIEVGLQGIVHSVAAARACSTVPPVCVRVCVCLQTL